MTEKEPGERSRQRVTSAAEDAVLSGIERVIPNSRLVNCEGVWTLLYDGREYMRLLDARSREDAEQQIAEMLFLRSATPVPSPNRKTDSVQRAVPVPDRRVPRNGVGRAV